MELPNQVAVMTLSDTSLFPQALLPLYIFEPRYRRMLADALRAHRMFAVAMLKPGCQRECPCPVAGLGVIRVSVDHPDGTSHLILQGLTRVRLRTLLQYKPYRLHAIEPLSTPPADNVVLDALTAKVFELVQLRLESGPSPFPLALPKAPGAEPTADAAEADRLSARAILKYLEGLRDPGQVADLVASALLSDPVQRQTILETLDLEPRLRHLVHFLVAETARPQKNSPA